MNQPELPIDADSHEVPVTQSTTGDNLPAVLPPSPVPEKAGGALADLQAAAMTLTPEQMTLALHEYEARRKTFREWLMKQLKEGVHYGYPPGTEPKYTPDGKMLMKGKVVNPKQWQPKQSLYQAGADFMCDLMGLAHEFMPDMESWEQSGKREGLYCFTCRLVSKQTGDVVGEGRGSHKIGQYKDDNTAIKMAQKCAKVAAVLNAYGLADLFTQDLENLQKEPHENPAANPDAPKAQPRGQRVTADESKWLLAEWRKWAEARNIPDRDQKYVYTDWVRDTTGEEFLPLKSTQWTRDNYDKCRAALEVK